MSNVDERNPGTITETKEQAPDPRVAVYRNLADRVRADSRDKLLLTSTAALYALSLDPSIAEAFLNVAAGEGEFADIRPIVAAQGGWFLYSTQTLTRKEAERLALGEEVRSQIAERVRFDSQKKALLTPIDSLGVLIPGAEPDKVDGHLAGLADDARYHDVHMLVNSRGARYLFSDRFMTSTYATVLVRAEAHDPVNTIVTTVREDSRLYPRPTSLRTFASPVFKMDPAGLEHFIDEIGKLPAYSDIKFARASNGEFYLYSDLYLEAKWVNATVEWEEVGKYENP